MPLLWPAANGDGCNLAVKRHTALSDLSRQVHESEGESTLNILAGIVVSIAGMYLVGLAMASFFLPSLSVRFLEAFASSARAHYLEQFVRLVVGTALVLFSPMMNYAEVFHGFGWLIIVTTFGLLLIPWQWHHRFGQWAIPLAVKNLKLFAVGALLLGVFIFYGLARAIV